MNIFFLLICFVVFRKLEDSEEQTRIEAIVALVCSKPNFSLFVIAITSNGLMVYLKG